MVVEQTEIYNLVKRAVTEAIHQERVNLYFSMLPAVDDAEMDEIRTELGSPSVQKIEDYIDITELLANEN
jgi:hypothetical protein